MTVFHYWTFFVRALKSLHVYANLFLLNIRRWTPQRRLHQASWGALWEGRWRWFHSLQALCWQVVRKVDPQIQKIIVSYQFTINQFKQLKTYVKSWGSNISFDILGIERPVKLVKRLRELEGAWIFKAQFSYHTEE